MKKSLALVLVAIGLVVAGQSAYAQIVVDFTAEIAGIGEDPYTYDANNDLIPDAAQLQALAVFLAAGDVNVTTIWNANLAIFDAGVAPAYVGLAAAYRNSVAGLLCIGGPGVDAKIADLNASLGGVVFSFVPNPAYVLTAYLGADADPDSDTLTNLQEWQIFGAGTPAGFTAFLVAETTPVAPLSAVVASGGGTVVVGLTANFTATVTGGTPPLTYEWKKGATVVGTSATLALSNVALTDAGSYTLTVTDSAATPVSVTSNAVTLTVETVPMPVMGLAGAALLVGLAGALGVRKLRK